MSTGMRATMAMMWMRMRKEKYCKLMMDQCGVWRTERILGLTWELVMSTGMRASMARMRMRLRSKKHRKPMIDQWKMWRTEGIVLKSVKIGQYISDL